VKRVWFGSAGHFVASNGCRFHLHTHIGDVCISTVGDYRPRDAAEYEKPHSIGSGRTFETMAFRLDADGDHDGVDIAFNGYNDRDAANLGHEAMLVRVESGEFAS
jgi:hypothetical protein